MVIVLPLTFLIPQNPYKSQSLKQKNFIGEKYLQLPSPQSLLVLVFSGFSVLLCFDEYSIITFGYIRIVHIKLMLASQSCTSPTFQYMPQDSSCPHYGLYFL